MQQYKRLFGITRVPHAGADILVGSHPSKAQHILVLYQDQLFVVDVYDSESGERITIASIAG
jgi:carnitine O-acetyltransferase